LANRWSLLILRECFPRKDDSTLHTVVCNAGFSMVHELLAVAFLEVV
jgi:hypothetical protein